jgi:hypothetical protein
MFPTLTSKLPNTGTSIFTTMSALANEYNAINLGQGFPDFPMDEKLSALAQKAMADKTVLFGKLPDKCTGCSKDYDKKNREHVTAWSVTVYAQSERVNLYCPECWSNVKAYLEDEARGLFNE